VWVLASCSNTFRVVKELLFSLGRIIYRMWGCIIVLFEEEMKVIYLEDSNRISLLGSFKEAEDLQ
jgi:hypothetical protein